MNYVYIFLILIFGVFLPVTKPITVEKILPLVNRFFKHTSPLFEIAVTANDYLNYYDVPMTVEEEKIFMKIDNINMEINEISVQINRIDDKTDIILKMFAQLRNELRYDKKRDIFKMSQNFLETLHNDMVIYVRDIDMYENSTLIKFANDILSTYENSAHSLIENIYNQFVKDDFLELYEKELNQNGTLFCHEGKSPNESFHQLLNQILILNYKSYILELTAYYIKIHFRLGKFKKERVKSYDDALRRHNGFILKFKGIMEQISNAFWRCDPQYHHRDESYIEITNFLHGYILSKQNLESSGRCNSECEEIKKPKMNDCDENEWCRSQPPCQKIIKCRYVDRKMEVCSGNIATDYRRYKYVKFETKKSVIKEKKCQNLKELETYSNWLIWKCSYCLCLCEESEELSDRFINLRLSMSNISDNRVVTGLRFVKRNRIIHLQIQEGKLLENGEIDLNTVQWIPIANYKPTKNLKKSYHSLSWESRRFYLRDLMAPKDSVITGVRLKSGQNGVDLEIVTTRFNLTTGKLFPNLGNSRISTDQKLDELKLTNPGIPTESKSSKITTRKYIQFVTTDDEKDIGQTTVPFFDSQAVEMKIPVPLSGIGVFHKGEVGSGGFIAPRIFTYDFSKSLKQQNINQN